MQNHAVLYEEDFYAWTQEQAKLIKEKKLKLLDINHLFEEVESMGISQRTELESRLSVILTHLLKWKYQPVMRSNGWLGSINENRYRLGRLFKQSPSLTNKENLQNEVTEAYLHAIKKATIETGLNKNTFPIMCEWTITQILDEDFLPN